MDEDLADRPSAVIREWFRGRGGGSPGGPGGWDRRQPSGMGKACWEGSCPAKRAGRWQQARRGNQRQRSWGEWGRGQSERGSSQPGAPRGGEVAQVCNFLNSFFLIWFIYFLFWLNFTVAQTFSRWGKQGLLSSCRAWASHWGGFSCCPTWALGSWAPGVVVPRL